LEEKSSATFRAGRGLWQMALKDNACAEPGLGPLVTDHALLSDCSFHDEEATTPRRLISCIISDEAGSSMPDGGDKEAVQACCSTGSEEEDRSSNPSGRIEKVALVQGQPLRGLTEDMQERMEEVLRRLEVHEVKIMEAVQRLDTLEALDLGRDRLSQGNSTPAAPQGPSTTLVRHNSKVAVATDNLDDSTARLRILHRASQALGHEAKAVMQTLAPDQAKAVMLPVPLSESSVGSSGVAQPEAAMTTLCGKVPAWKAVLRAELRAEVQARGAALEARLAAVEAAFQTGLKSADARLSSSAIALAGTGAELRSLVPRVQRLEAEMNLAGAGAAAGESLQQLAIKDASLRMASEAEPSAEASAAEAAASSVPAALGPPLAATRIQAAHRSRSISFETSVEATPRCLSQAPARYPSEALSSTHSAGASRPLSVPPYRTPQNVSGPTYRPVPVHSWSHVAAPQSQTAPPSDSFRSDLTDEVVMEEVPVLPYWSRAATSRTKGTAFQRRPSPLESPVGSASIDSNRAAAAAWSSGQGAPMPQQLAAAQEATSEVVRRMMDSMGGFEAPSNNPHMSAWMEAASTGAWAPQTAPPPTSNARRRRFMDPQQQSQQEGQSQQQQQWLHH